MQSRSHSELHIVILTLMGSLTPNLTGKLLIAKQLVSVSNPLNLRKISPIAQTDDPSYYSHLRFCCLLLNLNWIKDNF